MLKSFLTVYLVLIASASVGTAHETTLALTARDDGSTLELPKAISDHTVVLTEESNGNSYIYILGGCDAENGNAFNKGFGEFICSSLSNTLYRFDPSTQEFTTLADMPTERYRHAAVAVNDYIWVAGGRDLEDNLIGTVDVYAIQADAWTSFDLDASYQSSDLAGFGHQNMTYFVGGYDATYNFLDAVYAIDTEATLISSALVIEDKAPLQVARGDLTATVNDDETYAIVTGGFGTTNEFCAPLFEVEQYDFQNDAWTLVAPMNNTRSDMALVELNGNIIALGGERQLENICEIDTPDSGEATLAVDDVEVLSMDMMSGSSSWTVLPDLPKNRFRFAAVALDAENAVYTFGGQEDYNSDCECYRTSRQVVIYDAAEVNHDHNDGQADSAAYAMLGYTWLALVAGGAVLV